MASKNEDVHLRLFFDGAKAAKTYELLTRLQEEYNKKMEEAKNIAKSKGVDPKNDADYKYWKGQLSIIKSMLKEAKKAHTDIHHALSSLSLQSMADLNSYAKYLEHRINSMSMKKKGAAQELAKLQRQLAQINDERNMRNAQAPSRALADIQKDIAKTDNSINKLRVLRQELETFRNSTNSASGRMAATAELRELDDRLKKMSAAPLIDLKTTLNNIANGTEGRSVERLKVLREEIVRLQQTSTNKADVKAASEAIADLDKRIASMTSVTMKGTDAELAYAKAQRALKDGVQGKAYVVRELVQQMQRAQKAEGISVQQSQKYVAMEKQLTDMLRNQAAEMMTLAQAHQAYDEAKRVMAERENASAAAVRNSIEQMKKAQLAEGASVQQVQMYAATQKKLEEQLKGTSFQYMHLRQVRQVVDQGDAARVTDINRAIESLQRLAKAEGTTAEQAKYYNEMLTKLQTRLKGVAYDENFVASTLRNIKTTPMENLERAAKMLQEQMKKLGRDQQAFVQAQADYQKIKQELDGINGKVKQTTTQFKMQEDAITRAAGKLMQYLGVFGGFYLVRQKIQEAFKANMDYDESITNIRKTTGLTSEAVEMLAENIKKIDTRTTLSDMANLAYSAGKLGVKGVSDVMAFVKSANILKVALGEQLGEGSEAVEQLMKINTIMGVEDQFGMEQSLLKTGAAINFITMNSQATAQPMVDFMKRVAGVSHQAGLATDELVGLAGAVNALGQPVEMSATSISKMLVQMEKNSRGVAQALQLTAKETVEFVNNLRTGHTMDALLTVLQKAREAGGLSHLSSIVKDLGGEGQRVIQTISTLSANYDKVAEMVRMSSRAFEEGTSAIDEYNIKNSNTAAQWERLKNAFSKMTVSPQAVKFIKELLESMKGLPAAVQDFLYGFEWVGDLVKGLSQSFSALTSVFTALAQAMMARAFISFGVSIASWGKAVYLTTQKIWWCIKGVNGYSMATIKARIATEGWSKALKSAQFGNVFTAAAAAVMIFVNAIRNAYLEEERKRKEMMDGLASAREQAKTETVAMNALLDKLNQTTKGTEARKQAIGELNKTYNEYLDNLLTEEMELSDVAAAMEAVNAQIELKSILSAKADNQNKIRENHRADIADAQEQLTNLITSFVVGEDREAARSAAAGIVRQMIASDKVTGKYFADDFLRKIVNRETGLTVGYTGLEAKSTSVSGTGQISSVDNKDYQDALARFQTLLNNVKLNDNFDFEKVLKEWANYMNEDLKQRNEIRKQDAVYDNAANESSSAAIEQYTKMNEERWARIEKNVSLNGTLTDFTKLTHENEVQWANIRDVLFAGGKNVEESNNVTSFLRVIDDLLLDLQGKNAQNQSKDRTQWTDEYRMWYDRQQLALEYQRIFNLGRLEPAPDNKGKQEANTGAKDASKSIMDKIRDFYKLQETEINRLFIDRKITETDRDRKLLQNDTNLNESLATALDRILGKITEKEWRNAVDVLAERNMKGLTAGASKAEEIRGVGDIRYIGEIFAKNATKILKTDVQTAGEAIAKSVANEVGQEVAQQTSEPVKQEVEIVKSVALQAEAIKKAMDYFIDELGITAEQAAGIIGPLFAESGMNPGAYNKAEKNGTFEGSTANGSGYGAGLAQWSKERKTTILDHLRKTTGKDLASIEDYDLEAQLETIVWELSQRRELILEMLKQQNDSTAATDVILRGYENGSSRGLATQEQIDRYKWNDFGQGGYHGSMFGGERNGKKYYGRAEYAAMAQAIYEGVDVAQFIADNSTVKNLTTERAQIIAESNATLDEWALAADKYRLNMKKNSIKVADEIAAAWLEQNPLGKIAQDFQKQFEELGLLIHIQPEVDVDGTVKRDLARVEDDLMQQMLEIGKHVSEYDMTTDDGRKKFAEFVNDLKKFPDVAKTAVLKTTEDIESFYYKAYEFAEQYEETITRIAEKNRKMWEKMYKHTTTYIDQVKELKAISEAIKLSDRMVQYGGSSMRSQAQKVGENQQKYDMAYGTWQNDIVQAQAEVAGAEALVAAGAPMAEERLREAREQLEIISQMPDEVRTAAEALNESMMALADSAFAFAGEMVSAFEKLADGMVPLRSWYEDKGSFVENVFGTKEERQQAFGAYMDDLKKTIRKTTMEQARLITQEAVMKAMARRKEQVAQAKAKLDEMKIEYEGLSNKKIIEMAKAQATEMSEQQQVQASTQGTAQRNANDRSQASVGMWGNFGKAISAAWADGGPYLGAVLAAVVSGVLGSLMTMVFNMMGSSSKTASAAPKTKLVSGMLTYDAGNVQSFPVMGDDGRVYMASTGGVPASGTGIVRRPTLTTVGGAPALVAERGPEMVIGRETTHAMMMSRPDLLRAIVEFDRNRSRGFAKTFDSGNLSSVNSEQLTGNNEGGNPQLMEVLDAQTAMLSQMYEINAALTAELRKGIGVRKYGAGGLIEETAAGFAEARRLGNNKNVTRLFGSR